MKLNFGHLLLVIALGLAATAAYFSVWGLSQLFAGASTAVIIMASMLEIGKVITTTALHRYWSKLAKIIKIYLSIGVIVLMVITSAGIYGFLSNAYQQTADKLKIHEGELAILDSKKTFFQSSIDDNKKIVDRKNVRIDQLSALRKNQETRIDSAKYTRAKDKARADIEAATKEIQKLTVDIDDLNNKNNVLSDSIGKYNVKMLELQANNGVSAEIGPLKYISELTGYPMGKVVNYLILLLIIVFDPLAVALILATNRVLELESKSKIESTSDDINDGVNDSVNEEPQEDLEPEIEEEITEPELVQEVPFVQPTEEKKDDKKLKLEDIKEIKERNTTPQKITNAIQRIGSNKILKDGNNDKVFFKRKNG